MQVAVEVELKARRGSEEILTVQMEKVKMVEAEVEVRVYLSLVVGKEIAGRMAKVAAVAAEARAGAEAEEAS